jgi:hypothetical protein
MPVEIYFPNLARHGYQVTSAADIRYNCIAWAAGQTNAWRWPDVMGQGHWPEQAPRVETIAAFIRAFETMGYSPCDSNELEPGFEKVALYAREGRPTHAARN